MRLQYAPYRLKFITPARTSRTVMYEKLTCFIRIFDENNPEKYGIGEAALFEGLSPEANDDYEYKLLELTSNIALGRSTDLSRHSSIQYGLEQAIYNFSNDCGDIYFPSPFTWGEMQIEINGLVWMNDIATMMKAASEKIEQGFKCVKFKIGALDWNMEYEMLRKVREIDRGLEIRVDANGAFTPQDALHKLEMLSKLNISSIEQPLPKGFIKQTAQLCKESPLPIALDEELTGIWSKEEKMALLRHVKPCFIVLKPALCGGFSGALEWIDLAKDCGVGYWVTSALESNVGLNALAQFTATLNPTIPQGLGTGALYENNFSTPATLHNDKLQFNPSTPIDRSKLDKLNWLG